MTPFLRRTCGAECLMNLQEEEILELEQKMQEMDAHNGSLVVELERVKNETKTHVQNCDKLSAICSLALQWANGYASSVRSVQKEAQEYQQSSKEAFRKCIDDLKSNLPELQGIKNELMEQMQSIETQLEEEHHHCARVGRDLLHELESCTYIAVCSHNHWGDKLQPSMLLTFYETNW
jgi:DNA repair exonuclease SbcCD ATPase subunit